MALTTDRHCVELEVLARRSLVALFRPASGNKDVRSPALVFFILFPLAAFMLCYSNIKGGQSIGLFVLGVHVYIYVALLTPFGTISLTIGPA